MAGNRAQRLRRFIPLGLAMIVLVVTGVFAYRGLVLTTTASPTARPTPTATTTPTPTPTTTPSATAEPSPSPSTGSATGTAALSALDAADKATLSVSALDLVTGRSVKYNSVNSFYTASIVKVDIVEALLLRAQDQSRSFTSTEKRWASAAITVSDNDAATALFDEIGRAAGLTAANKRLGLTSTVVSSSWGLTRTSATDQVAILRALTSTSSPLASASRSYLVGLMSSVVADERWGVPAAGTGTPTVKNGWLPVTADGGAWEVNSIGIVTSNGHTVLVAVLTRKGTSMSSGIQLVEKAAKIAVTSLTA